MNTTQETATSHCSFEGCTVYRDTFRDRMGHWYCPAHALKRGSLSETMEQAAKMYVDLPWWVLDALDLGVLEICADVAKCFGEGTTDALHDELIAEYRCSGQEHDVSPVAFYCAKIDRVLFDQDEPTKVESARCPHCGKATSCGGAVTHS
jgi:hypothetical protein